MDYDDGTDSPANDQGECETHEGPQPMPEELGEGTNAIWLGGVPRTAANLVGQVFVTHQSTSPQWTETSIALQYSTFTSPPSALDFVWLNSANDPAKLIDDLKSGTVYYESVVSYDLLTPPSLTWINGLSGTLSGTPYLVKNGSTTRGCMFRRSLGSNAYADFWLLESGYNFTGPGVEMTETPDPSGKTNLKDFLLANVAGATWYIPLSYTWVQHTKP